jgi:hypothetical protein
VAPGARVSFGRVSFVREERGAPEGKKLEAACRLASRYILDQDQDKDKGRREKKKDESDVHLLQRKKKSSYLLRFCLFFLITFF